MHTETLTPPTKLIYESVAKHDAGWLHWLLSAIHASEPKLRSGKTNGAKTIQRYKASVKNMDPSLIHMLSLDVYRSGSWAYSAFEPGFLAQLVSTMAM